MTPHREWFSEYHTLDASEKVSLGDGHIVDAIGVGKIHVMLNLGRKVRRTAII